MYKSLVYLFDPLCGWCYGAAPYLSSIAQTPGVNIELLPTGLFSNEGARPMDPEFATYAWSNDVRIARLTGQQFTETYRQRILGDHQKQFDSGPSTIALTAVSLTAPSMELEALKAIQLARFVNGQDITAVKVLVSILKSQMLYEAAAMLDNPDESLLNANRTRTTRAQGLMRELGASGVPTFIADSDDKRWVVHTSTIFTNPLTVMH